MTLLIASIAPTSLDELVRLAERAWACGAEAVEVRIDAFGGDLEEVAAFLRAGPRHRWIVTCRSRKEGGHHEGSPHDRLAALATSARKTSAVVDLELDDWRALPVNEREVLRSSDECPAAPQAVILSKHDVAGPMPEPRALLAEMSALPGAVGKVAYLAHHICDTFAALDAMHQSPGRGMVIAMGEDGLWTRVLAKKLGVFGSYVALEPGAATAPGQATVEELLRRYRWPAINEDTRVFGVIGDPVAQSLSPTLFNHWFAEKGLDAVYLPLLVRRHGDCVRRYLDGCRKRPWLDLGGFSVTAPHKSTVLHWLGEGADSMSRAIGAVNTLSFAADRVRGFNTDCNAAIASLADALGVPRSGLADIRVDVLGTGGAARAVLHGLQEVGAKATVYGRSTDRTRRLAGQFHAAPRSWEERTEPTGDAVINCTSVGLGPGVDESPLPDSAFHHCKVVFDLIYNPMRTRLLREAEQAGVKTLGGLDMFVRQAAVQFELWTGQRPALESARAMLSELLRGSEDAEPSADPSPRTIALIGMRGAGKTTVGRELAEITGGSFLDTDDLVTAEAGRSIAAIFASEGEDGFRRRERVAIQRAIASPPEVVAVGGGAVLDPRNVEDLRRVARVVWLTASMNTLLHRVAADPATAERRPPLAGLDDSVEMSALLTQREPLYARAAHLVVNTDGLTPRQAAERVRTRLAEK